MIENERKFHVEERFLMPDLAKATAGVAGAEIIENATVELDATYFDTADLRLLHSGATLRRRLGGSDEGWHLKLPTSEAHERIEVHRPLGAEGTATPDRAAAVPDELSELVFARLRGAPLQPIARLRTERRVIEVRGPDGLLLANVADDRVTARRPDGAATQWRELEVEQSPAGAQVADRIVRQLVRNGAEPDEGGPKLARALGLIDSENHLAAHPDHGGSGRHRHDRPRRRAREHPNDEIGLHPVEARAAVVEPGPMLAAVLRRLRQQYEELVARDLDVRRQGDDAVHRMRVAARRLRSCLRSFGEVFVPARVEALRGELGWLTSLLGEARDAEVLRRALEKELDALPPEQVLGPVRATLSSRLVGREAVAGEELLVALRDRRYAALLEALSRFVEEAPLAGEGDSLEAPLRKAVRRDLRRVRRRMAAAEGERGERRNVGLHEGRKAAKRARYALETVTPVFGSKAARLAGRYEALQEALGAQHDAVVIGDLLRSEGARAGVRPGENGYTFGLLAGLQRCQQQRFDDEAWRAFARADRRKGRRFLS